MVLATVATKYLIVGMDTDLMRSILKLNQLFGTYKLTWHSPAQLKLLLA
jgi:hypothetical protein